MRDQVRHDPIVGLPGLQSGLEFASWRETPHSTIVGRWRRNPLQGSDMDLSQLTGHIWLDGEMVPWQDARVRVRRAYLPCLYGLGCFRGVRA